MGHLVDAQREQRGTGFELRTDEYGAVRAAKGIFLAAHEQPKAQGQVLEMTPAVNQITQANSQMQALSVRDPLVKNVVDRLAVKHHSEWSKGRSIGRWEGFL
jgi:hypothetical protein